MSLRRSMLAVLLMSFAVVVFSCEKGDNEFGDVEDELDFRAGTVSYQAENHSFQSGCKPASNHIGYTGTGFMDYGGNGSLVEWNNVNVPSAGQYKLTFRYANGSAGSRQCVVTLNDTTTVGTLAFEPSGAWTTWSTVSIDATLKAGNNKIRVAANTGRGGPNLDKMDVTSIEEGSGGSSGCVEVAEHQRATLSCPSGQVIGSIDFASYGVPTGSCSSGFSTGTCHASTSKSKVESLCLNKESCTVGANNATFGDPCHGTFKKMAIKFSCDTGGGGGGDTDTDTDTDMDTDTDTDADTDSDSDADTDSDSDADTDSDSDADTDSDGDNSVAPGVYNTVVTSLPGNEPTACEWDWTVRMLHYMPKAIVPRRMYYSACKTGSPNPEMFTSLSVGKNAPHPERDPTSGGIVRSRYVVSTGKFETIDVRHFPECLEMHGIATSADCSTIAALCRIPSGTSGADKDSLATHPSADWMTQPHLCSDKKNDEMWLYEWTNGDITTKPKRYIVHKAIGSWEYGNNYLRYGENDNTYGIAVKATVGNGSCHEADAFLVLDRSDYDMTNRAWSWACGTGHTLFNRPAYDPTTKKYAMMCSTDYNQAQEGGMGAYFFRMEDGSAKEFHHLNLAGIKNKGGASALVARPGGGFLGVLVGVDGQIEAGVGYPLEPPTGIGLVKFDANGNQIGGINWVLKETDTYLSYSQISPLGNNRYLLGWGVMKKLNDPSDTTDESYRIPWEFYVMEIDENGKHLTEPMLLKGTGWGEQDQLISLGNGRVAWTYIEKPALTTDVKYPSCNADKLQLSVYISPNN